MELIPTVVVLVADVDHLDVSGPIALSVSCDGVDLPSLVIVRAVVRFRLSRPGKNHTVRNSETQHGQRAAAAGVVHTGFLLSEALVELYAPQQEGQARILPLPMESEIFDPTFRKRGNGPGH